jgi:hypothetical protein
MAEQTNLLELIRAQGPKVIQAVQNAGAVAVDNTMKAEGVVQGLEKTYEQAGRDQALVVLTAQTGALQAQQASRKALDAAGGMDALYSTISTLRSEQQRLTPELERLRQENVDASGLNILGIIKQRLDWNGTQAKVESSIQSIKATSSAGQEIEQRVNAAGTIARNTAETMTVASVEAASRVAAAEWAGRAAQARLEALKYNSQTFNEISSAEDKTLEVLTRAQNVERGEQQFQLALREEERRREQFEWTKEAALAARTEKLEGKALDDSFVYKLNLGRAARGLAPLEGLEAKQALQLLKSNNPDMVDLYRKGDVAATTGIGLIGYSPADTASVISKNPQILQDLPPERRKALDLVVQAQRELAVARGRDPNLADDKDGAKAAAYINKYVNDRVDTLSSSIGNNFDNPFHLGDLTSYIGTATSPGVSAFQAYPSVQKILNVSIAGGMSLADPNVVVGQIMAGVRKGDLTSSQAAADISNIYRRANLLHRRAVGFETLGISLPAAGAGYVAKINGEMVDVTDFTAVARAMNIQLLREAARGTPMDLGVRGGLANQTDPAIFGITEAERLRRQIRLQDRKAPL